MEHKDFYELFFQGGFAIFVIKEIWQSFKGKDKEYETALKDNTMALVELRSELKYLGFQMQSISERVKTLESYE